MTYQDKVKQSKEVLQAIKSLKDGEQFKFTYGKNHKREPREFKLKAYMGFNNEMSYSIWAAFDGMNIDALTKTQAKAYTFDMMSQRTTYNFPLYEMKIIK